MNYYDACSRMNDDELKRFALHESKDLESDAYGELLHVLKDRCIDSELIKEMESIYSKYSEENIKKITTKYMNTICPICNNCSEINAIKFSELYSIVFYTKFKSRIVVGCYSCLKDALLESNINSLCLGPWGFPFGIFGTPIIIVGNILKFKRIDMKVPSNELKRYVKANIDLISKGVK